MTVMSERFIVLTTTETHHFTVMKWITQNYNFHEVLAFSIMIIVHVWFCKFLHLYTSEGQRQLV